MTDPAGRLVALALALGAEGVAGWSAAEAALARAADGVAVAADEIAAARGAIAAGADPLGEAFRALRAPAERRPLGATYTPAPIVAAMVGWAADRGAPARVVDPGSGSARFAVAAGRRFPGATLVGVELDPLAALVGRAHLAAAGLADRARVRVGDYRAFRPGAAGGPTLYLGNPPYVRHHEIPARGKEWLARTARERGLPVSRLAGLHVHFLLAIAAHARTGDEGALITSAEWLDVNYGRLVRALLLDGLGGEAVHVVDPGARPFEDAATTAAIICFRVGARPAAMRLRRVRDVAALGRLEGGEEIPRERLAAAGRWTPLMRAAPRVPEGHVELGELCRVHRGAVTGANATFVVDGGAGLPASVLFRAVTRARELFAAGPALASAGHLRHVVDIPPELDAFDADERRRIEGFLRAAKRAGAADGYIARNRRVWWAVGLRAPAPILATYMARRPPAFVLNAAGARHINIAHGLYPRQEMPAPALARLVEALRASVTVEGGRTYAGGLTKFEPREMERLPVPAWT